MIYTLPQSLIESAKQLIDNENFKTWFGKSKLAHDDGQPMTFYHGTDKDFSKFSHEHVGKGNDAYGSGFYFTNKPHVASGYATDKEKAESPNVMKVHLRLENPISPDDETPLKRDHIKKLIINAPDHKESLMNFGDVAYEGYNKVLNSAVDAYAGNPKFDTMNTISNDFYAGKEGHFLENFKKITGHDGVIIKHDDHIIANVFHPNQIKSATGNTGAYSKKSDELTEQAKSWHVTTEPELHVTKREPMLPIEHVRQIVKEHQDLGHKLVDDPAVVLHRPLVTNRGGGCSRTIHMKRDDDNHTVLHIKFKNSQNTPHSDYKITRELKEYK